jgi:hypothetical protein
MHESGQSQWLASRQRAGPRENESEIETARIPVQRQRRFAISRIAELHSAER